MELPNTKMEMLAADRKVSMTWAPTLVDGVPAKFVPRDVEGLAADRKVSMTIVRHVLHQLVD
jgi:hypothetical protein